jgi:superoxide dismutase, Cu-Zn family
MTRTIVTALLLASVAACASGGAGGGPPGPRRQGAPNDSAAPAAAPNTTARAELRDANGNSIGSVTLTQTRSGVLVVGHLTSLPAGPHALHVHDVGRCEAPFTSAGGHFNPTQRSHGYKSPMANHAGDLPNFLAVASGDGHVEAISRDLSLAPGPVGLFDGDGASLVVHAGADDYQSDPAGNSGNRIACGVITR